MNKDKLDQYIEQNLSQESSDQKRSEDKIAVDQSDIFDKAFRLGLALLPSAFITGIAAGIMEARHDIEIPLGIPIIISITVLSILFWKFFSRVGPFKKNYKYIEKPVDSI